MLGWDAAFVYRKAMDFFCMDPSVLDLPEDTYDFNADEVLSSIKCPVMLTYGNPEMGGVLTEQQADEIKNKIDDCVKNYVPDAGHVGPNERIVDLNDFLLGI